VRTVRETGKPIAQVARDLGINEGTLGNWIARNRQARAGGNGALTEDQRVQLLQLDRYLGKTGFSSQQTKQKQPLRRPGEPVGAGRRTRQPGKEHRAVTMGLTPPRPARRRGERGTDRRCGPGAGPPAVTGMAKALPWPASRRRNRRCRSQPPTGRRPRPASGLGGQWRRRRADRCRREAAGWAATAAGHAYESRNQRYPQPCSSIPVRSRAGRR
jgi:transposase-like protein